MPPDNEDKDASAPFPAENRVSLCYHYSIERAKEKSILLIKGFEGMRHTGKRSGGSTVRAKRTVSRGMFP